MRTWSEFTVRQSQGGSQKYLQKQRKLVGGEGRILYDVSGQDRRCRRQNK